jgi:hypothetical protein
MLPAVALLLRPILAAGLRRAVGGAVVKSAARRELGKTLGKRAAGEAVRSFADKPALARGESSKAARVFAKAAKGAERGGTTRPTSSGRLKLDLSSLKGLFGRSKPAQSQSQSAASQRTAKLDAAFAKQPTQSPRQFKSSALQSTQAFPVASTPGQAAGATPAGPTGDSPAPAGAPGAPFPASTSPSRASPAPFSQGVHPIARPLSSIPQGGTPAHKPSEPPPETGASKRSFSGLAAKNFGDLLSGKTTPAQVNAKADQQDREASQSEQKEHDEAAKKEATEQLKNLGKAALAGGVGLLAMPAIAKKFTDALVSSQQGLKKFNGQIGIAFAKLERGDIRRQQQSGARTSNTLVPLIEATNEMKNETQKLSDVGSNILNTVGLPIARGITQIVKGINFLASKAGFKSNQPVQMNPWQRHVVNMGTRYGNNARAGKFQKPAKGPAGGARGGGP